MKKFVIKTILILLPLMVLAISMEYLIRNIPNDYSYKKEFLETNSNNIEVLFLGSSHTYYGITPEYISYKAFNASHISQSIDYDFEILKKYDGNWNELKYIAVPIDYFTLFSRVSTGGEAWRVKNYGIYYGIKKEYNLEEYSEFLSVKPSLNLGRIRSYYLNKNSAITCSELGYGNNIRAQMDLEETGIKAAIRHTKSDKSYFMKNLIVLKDIIAWGSKNDVKIIFYTSPAFQTYISNLDKRQLNTTINTIHKLTENNRNCFYFNLLNEVSFIEEDFRDADHLNKYGAKKLTLKLNKIIQGIEKNTEVVE